MSKRKYDLDKIDELVSFRLQGVHGEICVILPEEKSTEEDWVKFNQDIAEIIYRSEKNKERKRKEAQ